MIINKEFPVLGQNVYVSFYTNGLIPIDLIGRCVHIKWANELSTFTLLTQASRHQFFFFSPLVLTVHLSKARLIHGRSISPAVKYKKKEIIKQFVHSQL